MATTKTFPAWLKEQEYRSDDVGAFAKEVAGRDDFPASGGKAIYDGYFETEGGSGRQAYERAWSEYESSPEPSLP
jgi:hypothetical protein